jgi:hypothetical protein
MRSRLASRVFLSAIFLATFSPMALAQTPPEAPAGNCSLMTGETNDPTGHPYPVNTSTAPTTTGQSCGSTTPIGLTTTFTFGFACQFANNGNGAPSNGKAGTQYYPATGQSAITTTTTGQCQGNGSTQTISCPGAVKTTITYATEAQIPTTPNVFTTTAQPQLISGSGSTLSCASNGSLATITTNCASQPCSVQSGGGSGGCICPGGCPPCTVNFVNPPNNKKGIVLASFPPPPPNCCIGSTPILIDAGGKGFILTDAADGVRFDIVGAGDPFQMGWTAPGADNAFLALPGPDGLVHNGKQLFGEYTPQPPSSNPNGFAALAVYDDPKNGGNGNGEIDPGDAIYSRLRLWIDVNHDGISQPEELHTLASLGVTSISLHYRLDRKTDQYGNVFRYRAEIDPDQADPDHVGRTAYDVYFVSIQPAASGTLQAGARKCPAPNPYYMPPAPALSDNRK